jgi:hypothetical protein
LDGAGGADAGADDAGAVPEACENATAWPPIMIVAARAGPVFTGTVYDTDPAPDRAADDIVIHEGIPDGNHVQPAVVVTAMEPETPAAVIEMFVGVTA